MTDKNKSETENQVRRVTKLGVVVGDKMDKTVVVRVERKILHPMYLKYIRRSSQFHAHDESNECRVGDKVLIEESRPISKLKRWNVKEIVTRAS